MNKKHTLQEFRTSSHNIYMHEKRKSFSYFEKKNYLNPIYIDYQLFTAKLQPHYIMYVFLLYYIVIYISTFFYILSTHTVTAKYNKILTHLFLEKKPIKTEHIYIINQMICDVDSL